MSDKASLGWLFTGWLSMDDQIALLSHPYDLPDDLVQGLQRAPMVDVYAECLRFVARCLPSRNPAAHCARCHQTAEELFNCLDGFVPAGRAFPAGLALCAAEC
jgi:hypothetical protein